MTLWGYLLLILVVAGGGFLGFLFQKNYKKNLKLILSFSGAFLLGITVLHLLPEAMNGASHTVGYWVLGGFFAQLILEQLSQGVEHGHIHGKEHARGGFAVQLMLGLCLHAFIEGMPLSHYAHFHEVLNPVNSPSKGGHLLVGIALHHAPAAFALTALLLHSGFKKQWVFICLAVFALMPPLGAFSASFIHLSLEEMKWLVAFVIGSFLHVSTTILFETDSPGKHAISPQTLAAILLGLGIALSTTLI